jgi:hypothetical protein
MLLACGPLKEWNHDRASQPRRVAQLLVAPAITISISVAPRPPVGVIRRIRSIRIRLRVIAIAVRIVAVPIPPPRKQQNQQDQAEHKNLSAGFQKPTSACLSLRSARPEVQSTKIHRSTLARWTAANRADPSISPLDTPRIIRCKETESTGPQACVSIKLRRTITPLLGRSCKIYPLFSASYKSADSVSRLFGRSCAKSIGGRGVPMPQVNSIRSPASERNRHR